MRTVYGDIEPRTAGAAARMLLERGQYDMIIERYGQIYTHKKNTTRTRIFRRYESLQRATAPLAEGVTPTGKRVLFTDIRCTLEQYGELVELTDVIHDTHEDPVLKEMMNVLGENASETIEEIRFNIIKAGSSVFRAGSVPARSSIDSTVARGELRQIVRSLRKNKAKPISQIISASAKVSTEPVAPAFFGLCHTDLVSDIRDVPGFVPVEQYSQDTKAQLGEIGKVEEIRFVGSPIFEPWLAAGASGTTYLSNGGHPSPAASADVYPILILARDAIGIVPFQGERAVTPSVINPDQADKSDPLAQRGYVGYKTYQTACILNDNWMERYEVLSTSRP